MAVSLSDLPVCPKLRCHCYKVFSETVASKRLIEVFHFNIGKELLPEAGESSSAKSKTELMPDCRPGLADLKSLCYGVPC